MYAMIEITEQQFSKDIDSIIDNVQKNKQFYVINCVDGKKVMVVPCDESGVPLGIPMGN